MKCSDIEIGKYDCAYSIMPPWRQGDGRERYIAVDKCLLPEILFLWENGIRTTGCCCGHGKRDMSSICVIESDIPKMKRLGYKVLFNHSRPGDEDMFEPQTRIHYGEIDSRMGFNSWDEDEGVKT